jgi:leader peptidase (prepilin peptidase)/N-methyltransferase
VTLNLLLSQGWLMAFFVLWVGLAVGSFLNVVIYRLPVMLERSWRRQAAEHVGIASAYSAVPTERFDLIAPRSRCGRCGTPIKPWHNVPVVSWLWLRGRCCACGTSISARYPLIEGLTGVLSLVVVAAFGYTTAALAALVLTWALIALAFIDLDTKLLPDSLTLPLLWIGLAVNVTGTFVALDAAVVGAIAGYLTLWSVYWAFKLVTGKEGMGYGDFKLLAALGAWFGWQALPMLVLVSSLVGVVIGGTYLLLRRSREAIPFGPYLAVAGWVTLLAHDRVGGLL